MSELKVKSKEKYTMDNHSQNMLCRVEQNDDTLKKLFINYPDHDGGFISSDSGDYLRLGAAIRE